MLQCVIRNHPREWQNCLEPLESKHGLPRARRTQLLRLFPTLDTAAPINSGVRRDVAEGVAQGRIVAPSEEVAVACIVGVFMAGVNRALDLSADRARGFAQELGTILLHGLGLGRTQAARIMREAVESVLK
jgi:hypothetical protein